MVAGAQSAWPEPHEDTFDRVYGAMDKIDFKKQLKPLYTATQKVQEVQADRGVFLCLSGQGRPGSKAYQRAIGTLYAMAYTVKFGSQAVGGPDFSVGSLECLYHDDPNKTPMSQWHWDLLIRIPAQISAAQLRLAKANLAEKKDLDASGVKKKSWNEGRCVQTMHVGPYDEVGSAYERLGAYAAEHRLVLKAPCHEVYLSDPRRVAPDKLKTIVRMGVRRRRAR